MDDLCRVVQAKMQAEGVSQGKLAERLGLTQPTISSFLSGRTHAPHLMERLTAWVEGVPLDEEHVEEAVVDPGHDPRETIPISERSLSYIRTVFGLDEGEPISVDQILQCCVLGSSDVVRRLQQMVGQEQPVTLDRLEAELVQLREGQERALHAMAKAKLAPVGPEHAIEQCAEALLARSDPMVIERMEMVCQARNDPPWKVIIGALLMWRDDLIGVHTDDVLEAPMPNLQVGRQLWSRQTSTSQPGQFKLPTCIICERAFQPGPNQHNPQTGCDVCGDANTLYVKNKSEQKRWREGGGNYKPTIRPPVTDLNILPDAQQRLAYSVQYSGLGPCTCGQVKPVEAESVA